LKEEEGCAPNLTEKERGNPKSQGSEGASPMEKWLEANVDTKLKEGMNRKP
jgi:hypothetical protein